MNIWDQFGQEEELKKMAMQQTPASVGAPLGAQPMPTATEQAMPAAKIQEEQSIAEKALMQGGMGLATKMGGNVFDAGKQAIGMGKMEAQAAPGISVDDSGVALLPADAEAMGGLGGADPMSAGVSGALKAFQTGNVAEGAGTAAGSYAGAAVGNAMLPGVGGAIGAKIGGYLGGEAGSAVGGK